MNLASYVKSLQWPCRLEPWKPEINTFSERMETFGSGGPTSASMLLFLVPANAQTLLIQRDTRCNHSKSSSEEHDYMTCECSSCWITGLSPLTLLQMLCKERSFIVEHHNKVDVWVIFLPMHERMHQISSSILCYLFNFNIVKAWFYICSRYFYTIITKFWW